MRMLILALILAIGFGGYSAAGHAMGPDNCAAAVQIDDCAPEIQKSSDHAQKHKASGNGVCVDCAHCCVSSIVPASQKFWKIDPSKDVIISTLVDLEPQSRLFSLLRPPRMFA